MEGESNYFGAAIFWSYIVAALFFTVTVIHTIINIRPNRDNGHSNSAFRQKLFGSLAVLGFATLSFNMLHVLIKSFQEWSAARRNQIPNYPIAAVWAWSIESTLFHDFAEALVENSARYCWSAAALLVTFSVCLQMGIEGPRHCIPRLWAFFCLSQILPISLTQNLFYVALLRSPSTHSGMEISRFPLATLGALYLGALAALPAFARTVRLMPLVLATRALLFVPLGFSTLPKVGSSNRRIQGTSRIAEIGTFGITPFVVVVLLLWPSYSSYGDSLHAGSSIETLFSHPAVSTLGCDFMLGTASFVLWHLSGGMPEEAGDGPRRS